jgi:NAD(P)-dependent dehydrogenase (short-subunit alcohol dehydrogenase family)
VEVNKRVALISGASSGFGLEAARALALRGWRVFGTSRKAKDNADGIEMIVLDVCDEESIRRCVEQVVGRAGRIDLLVNNAGCGLYGFAEEASIEQLREIFETNFFGLVRMTAAVLPVMRSQRCGRIINIGSLGGLVGMPYRAFYSATKYAIEGYSESLSYEVVPFNIKVSIVEPGFFRTGLHHAMAKSSGYIAGYDVIRDKLDKYFGKGNRRTGEPARVGRLIADIAQEKSPRLRYRIGPYSILMPLLKLLLPQRLYAAGFCKWLKLAGDKKQLSSQAKWRL